MTDQLPRQVIENFLRDLMKIERQYATDLRAAQKERRSKVRELVDASVAATKPTSGEAEEA